MHNIEWIKKFKLFINRLSSNYDKLLFLYITMVQLLLTFEFSLAVSVCFPFLSRVEIFRFLGQKNSW
ncbi:unnamed protein product [Blepharisma stoltei]|uniref:Uncharacterized protein n=1 Tax=Blepharisma stoltei TaxID=1481888 RepID=A0AAU9J3M8_9CILI|nr:unnamed protein product [Blepharisma stoltei]